MSWKQKNIQTTCNNNTNHNKCLITCPITPDIKTGANPATVVNDAAVTEPNTNCTNVSNI